MQENWLKFFKKKIWHNAKKKEKLCNANYKYLWKAKINIYFNLLFTPNAPCTVCNNFKNTCIKPLKIPETLILPDLRAHHVKEIDWKFSKKRGRIIHNMQMHKC